MILGVGAENPDIIIVTDYGTEEEFSNNKAFVGSTNTLFNQLFNANQYALSRTYRTVFCKDRAPKHIQALIRKGKYKLKQLPTDAQEYLLDQKKFFDEEMKAFNPKVIIGAGDIPLWYLANELKCRKFRGSIVPSNYQTSRNEAVPFVSIMPPRWIYSDIKWKVVTQLDIGKAIGLLTKKWKPFPEGYHIWTAFTDASLREGLKRCYNSPFCTADIETIYNFITCIGIAPSNYEAIVVPLMDPRVSLEETAAMMKTLDTFFRCKTVKIVNQNINYDWTVMEKRGFKIENVAGDTMILSHVIYPDFPKGLDFLTSVYTEIPYYKDDGKEAFRIHSTKDKALDKLYLYNGTDCVATRQVYEEQLKEAEESGVLDFYEKVEFPLLAMYHDLEKNGILVDWAQLDYLKTKYLSLLAMYEQRVRAISEDDINFASPKQVAEFVYGFLECPPRFNRSVDEETGEVQKALATDEETLENLAFFYVTSPTVKEMLYCIVAIRKLQKILKFLETPIHPDGRMRTSSKLTGTKSGRTAFAKSIDYTLLYDKKGKFKKQGFGNSFQTLPKHGDKLYDGVKIGDDLRTIFVPRRNHVFIEGDKSQAEARVVAVLSDNLGILYYFDNPPGIHKITAGWIYGCDPNEIKKDTEEYNMGKRGRHMANYNGGADRLAMMINRPKKTAEFVLDRIHSADPSIRGVFHARVQELLENRETFETPQGRKRTNLKRVDEDLVKEYYSYIPQATVSDDVKTGLDRMWRPQSEDPWFWLLNEAHDSALAEVHKDNKNRYVDLFNVEMQKPINFRNGSFKRDLELVIPVELNWSDTNWKAMERL
jgi:DNA polymerase I-like protein with 3'-5' exonuclease and polymerase domains/uracil-DNA glycosylase